MSSLWKKRSESSQRHPEPDAAIADYMGRLQRAEVAGAPPPPSALNGLGDAYLDKEDIEAAIDSFRQAAEAYARAGLHNNAIACCRKIRRHVPDDPRTSLLLGRFYTAKGLRADALIELEGYADRHGAAGNRSDLIEAVREIVRLAPDRADRRQHLGRLLDEEGSRAAAPETAAGPPPGSLPPPLSPAPPRAMPREAPLPIATAPAPAATGPAAPLEIEHTSYRDMADARVVEPASLSLAAERLRADRSWSEAATAYRRLAETGGASATDYDAWAECARQTGEPARVIESLAAAARWYQERNDLAGARRAAEEMLLIDPRSRAAGEILDGLREK